MILLCQLISLFFIFIKSTAKWFVEVVVEDIAAGAAVHDGSSSSSSSRSSSGRGSSSRRSSSSRSSSSSRHFSVAPYITICPSTETYFGLYLKGAMSAVTGIYLFRLLLNIIFFLPWDVFFTLTNSAYPDELPHDGISPVCKCKKHVPKNIFHNWNAAENLFKSYLLFHTCMHSLVVTCE